MKYHIAIDFGEELTGVMKVYYRGEMWVINPSDWLASKRVGLEYSADFIGQRIDWHSVKVSLTAKEMTEERERMRADGRL